MTRARVSNPACNASYSIPVAGDKQHVFGCRSRRCHHGLPGRARRQDGHDMVSGDVSTRDHVGGGRGNASGAIRLTCREAPFIRAGPAVSNARRCVSV